MFMRFLFLAFAAAFSSLIQAQAPALIPYQAIARDPDGQPLGNTALNARFTIHDGSAAGPNIWQELQTVSTNALGLFSVQLGSGMPLTAVNWAVGNKYMQVEIDLGSGFVDIGTQQILSVPYALHSGSVHLDVSETGDTLFVGDGSFVIVPGISEANNQYVSEITTGTTLHRCGAANVHNPELTYGSMVDQEGQVYKTIIIGSQEWMAENLNTSSYRNGDPISGPLNNTEWANTAATSQGAWAYFNNDAQYACPYGRLYNWFACVDSRGLCPVGWHVPTITEWTTLLNYLDPAANGGNTFPNNAGGQIKSAGTLSSGNGYWEAPNENGFNSSGFSGLPAGQRYGIGGYNFIGFGAFWWSSTNTDDLFASHVYLSYFNGTGFTGSEGMRFGLSVRCIKN
jgi:uncharacterized protein (TIGR02145 family)